MWPLDVAPSPPPPPHTDSLSSLVSSSPHPEQHFPLLSGGRAVGVLVSEGSVCGWTLQGMPLVLLLQTAWVWGPRRGSGALPGLLQSLWLPSVTVPWIEAAGGL